MLHHGLHLAGTLLTLLVDVVRFLRLCLRPAPVLAAENLFLRQQLACYQERHVTPRRATDAARFILVWLARWFDWRQALVIVQPQTFTRWHRQGFGLFWRWTSRPGRPPIPPDLQALIRRMARENPSWGEDRAVGDHARGARVQPLEDGPAGGERGGAIQGLRGNAGGPEGRGHGRGQGDRRGKEQSFPVRGMGLECREDLRRGVGREEQGFEFGLDKISLLGAQDIEIGLEQHLEGAQIDQIARLHHLQQGFPHSTRFSGRPMDLGC